MILESGTKLGPYEILAPIGAGGMGEVYRAKDTRLDRIIAIKVSNETFSEHFEREARTVAALNHPNICQLYDVGPNYLVMEYIEGAPIAPVEGLRKLLDLVVQIADGMAAAHAAGIVHRDLKPDNILVTRDGRVKILDFGLAKTVAAAGSVAESTRTINDPGTVVGTIAYMSPEQVRGTAGVDSRSDQFSFGLILYELVKGERAFKRGSAAETMAAILRDEHDSLPASTPAPLRWIVERLLTKEPTERYDSTRDLYRDLRQVRDRLSETTAAVTISAPTAKRRHGASLIWIAPMTALGGFLAAALWPVSPSQPPLTVPFTTEAEIETSPAWSAQGDRIAYSADIAGMFQIFTKTPGSATPTQITHQRTPCFNPFWSADGARIFYISGIYLNWDLWSVAVAGGQADKVLGGVIGAALSPDGKTMAALIRSAAGLYRLAFSSPPGAPPELYSRPPLSNFQTPFGYAYLNFTANGKYLGLSSTAAGRGEFWRIPLDGRRPEQMISGGDLVTRARKFTWLDDQNVIGDDGPLGFFPLELVNMRTGARRWLSERVTQQGSPALSPDRRTLAYANGAWGYDIVEVSLDGSAQHDVIATSRNEVAPTWAPDGTHFAYTTDRSGEPEIWLRDRADGSERLIVGSKILPGKVSIVDSAISPDGNRIAYRVFGSGMTQSIWISPLSGEGPSRLWDDPTKQWQRGSSWSPDGNWIAFYSIRDGKMVVLKARVGGKERPEVVAYSSQTRPSSADAAGQPGLRRHGGIT
jgi:serine/threonine protein kinase